MYQKKCFKRPEQRYGAFVAKLNAEKALSNERQNLLNVLTNVLDKKSEEYWLNTILILEEMQKELAELGKVPSYKQPKEVINFCVALFDITSRYQDALGGELLCAPAHKEDAYHRFNNDLYYCGRHKAEDLRQDSEYGPLPYWNTTNPGEPITMENICFGPEAGLPRKPASYWVTLPKKKRVFITEVTTYSKGKLTKDVAVWATEGLVKTGIYGFCKKAIQSLTADLEDLLSEQI